MALLDRASWRHPLAGVGRRNAGALRISAACYGGGMILGALLAAASGRPHLSSPAAGGTTMWSLFTHNAIVLLLLSSGVLTLGLTTGVVLITNGAIFSYAAIAGARAESISRVILALLPHGLIEISATILAGGAGFITLRLIIARLDGRRPPDYRRSLLDFGIMIAASVLLLLPAAVLEFFVSARLSS